MTYVPVGSGDAPALLTTNGTPVAPDQDGYVTLTTARYVFMLDGSDPELLSAQLLTDATIAFTATVEGCNFPRFKGGSASGTDDVTDWDASGSKWTQINPTTAQVDSTGTGWSILALALTKTAGVGSAAINLGNFGMRRCRLNVNVTTGGKVRVGRYGKKG